MRKLCVGLFLFSSFGALAQSDADVQVELRRIKFGKGVSLSIQNNSEKDRVCTGKVYIRSVRRALVFPVKQSVPAGVLNVSAYYLPTADDQIYHVNHDMKCVPAR